MYVPAPYPDELIGSLMARAAIHTGLSFGEIIAFASGRHSENISIFLPRGFAALAKPAKVSAVELLQKHTIFPYATAFMPLTTMLAYREGLLTKASVRSTAALVQNLAMNASRYIFCPECIANDVEKYGETYWHRSHFVPGLSYCPWHERTLLFLPSVRQSGLSLRPGPSLQDISAATPVSSISNARTFITVFVHRSLAALSADWTHKDNWLSEYRSMALEHAYKISEGIVASSQLALNLQEFLGQATLEALGCPYQRRMTSSWPATMVRPHTNGQQFYAPIRHLLLYAFLKTSVPHEGPLAYKIVRLSSVNYEKLDKQFSEHALAQWSQARAQNKRVEVGELFSGMTETSIFLQKRRMFPLTASVIEDFKRSEQAAHQIGRRRRSQYRQATSKKDTP